MLKAGSTGRLVILVLAGMAVLITDPRFAWAVNSLGLGNPEQAIQPTGPLAGMLFWIQEQQKEFYRLTSEVLKHIRSGEGGMWLLVGLSFAYGVLHAAGPGHGKAVISSYMVANEVVLRRGVVLSFASAALQAIVAIVAIGLLTLVLAGMGIRQSNFTRSLELASYGAITFLGAWLLWRKIFPAKSAVHEHSHDHADGVCDCGHLHAPDPSMLEGKFGFKEAMAAVLAVGLRPCSGALIVLSFAFLNGLYMAGIASAFAMALGTGLTVAIIASIAVLAKGMALRISGRQTASAPVLRWIEITGAGAVFLLGLTLLSASLI